MDVLEIVRRMNAPFNRTALLWVAGLGFLVTLYMWDDPPTQITGPVNRTNRIHEAERNNTSPYMTGPQEEQRTSFSENSKPKGIEAWLSKYRNGAKRPNVLFLIADDMRPDIRAQAHSQSPWINPHMVTPSLDGLASESLLLRRAYCQQSWCNPSRSSFLTSRRPDTTMVHNNSVFFRQVNPNFVTIPQYFKQQGYLSLGMGKVFHLMGLPGDHDDEFSWTLPMFRNMECVDEGSRCWKAIKDEEREGLPLLDELVTEYAIETLQKIAPVAKSGQQPFFVAVGMKKPHLNFVFPSQFLDQYPLENISLPINPKAPLDLPEAAWFHSNEIRGRPEYTKETSTWTPDKPLADWVVKELRRAYWATISYVDTLIGRLVKKLGDLGLADDTIVVFIGDHGFHLGEQSIIGKNTNFEVANNSPMIIRVPGVTDQGLITDKLVEFVDLFPTLVELAGLPPVPHCPGTVDKSKQVNLCTEGSSLVPLLQDQSSPKWKDRVFYQYPHYTGAGDEWCMGYTVRTEQYRYTEWVDYQYPHGANWNASCGAELYDVLQDPNETNNKADDSQLVQVRDVLSKKLRAGWAQALPR